jgi:hypothetical protein
LVLTFFGLTPDYRLNLFTQIHEIVFHGKGGYSWETVFDMPIWLRNFTFKKIVEFYNEGNNTSTSNVVEQSINAMKSVGANKKTINPSYSTKIVKK